MKSSLLTRAFFLPTAVIVLGGSLALGGCGNAGLHHPDRAPAGDLEDSVPAEEPIDSGEKDPRDDGQGESERELMPPVSNEDSSCRNVPSSLRRLFYTHYEKMANGKDLRSRTQLADRMAKLLGITLKESSGNSACVTDMSGQGSNTSDRTFFRENSGRGSAGDLKISLAGRTRLLNLGEVTINKQTNYGLLQMSADRLTGARNREIYATYKNAILENPARGAAYCGSTHVISGGAAEIRRALTEAAECREGYNSTAGVRCFATLVTICPALNVQLGLNAPAAYFATRRATSKCSSAFTFLAKSM